MICRNDMAAKRLEVVEAMGRVGDYPGMVDLWKRGVFRHALDVAYARVSLQKFGKTVDQVAEEIHQTYVLDVHGCDPVLPEVAS